MHWQVSLNVASAETPRERMACRGTTPRETSRYVVVCSGYLKIACGNVYASTLVDCPGWELSVCIVGSAVCGWGRHWRTRTDKPACRPRHERASALRHPTYE